MISFKVRGSLKTTFNFFGHVLSGKYLNAINRYGRQGVAALSSMTPVDSGTTAGSWSYEVESGRVNTSIAWTNGNVTSTGVPIVILLQYGHGTGTGGYVQGRDFINPAIQPIMDRISEEVWREVTRV